MFREFRPALSLLVAFTLMTGLAYPVVITALAQLVMPGKANGSLLAQDGKVHGSRLIGQPFSDPKHFWSRPSATAPYPYNAAASSGSNLGPLNPALKEAAEGRVKALREADQSHPASVPVDLVTTSASGLDPHITPAAAEYQVARVARVRGLDPQAVRALVARHTEDRQWGFLGEPRVNVLLLNLDLDRAQVGAHGDR